MYNFGWVIGVPFPERYCDGSELGMFGPLSAAFASEDITPVRVRAKKRVDERLKAADHLRSLAVFPGSRTRLQGNGGNFRRAAEAKRQIDGTDAAIDVQLCPVS